MNHDYATIAASTIASILLAFNPVAAGDAGKKASAGTDVNAGVSVSADSRSASSKTEGVKDDMPQPDRNNAERAVDADKKTGLDRADQAAGQHGQQGRDTARENQQQNDSPSASPTTGDVKQELSKDKNNAEKPVK